MQAADLSPVPVEGRTQSGWDLFLLFAAANIVATTMQVGASLAGVTAPAQMLGVVAVGAVLADKAYDTDALVAGIAQTGAAVVVPSKRSRRQARAASLARQLSQSPPPASAEPAPSSQDAVSLTPKSCPPMS